MLLKAFDCCHNPSNTLLHEGKYRDMTDKPHDDKVFVSMPA